MGGGRGAVGGGGGGRGGGRAASSYGKKRDHGKPPEGPPPSLGKMFGLSKPEWPMIGFAFVLQVTGEMVSLRIPIIMATAYNVVVMPDKTTDEKLQEVNDVMVMVVVCHVVASFISFICSAIMSVAGERIVARVRNDLYGRILGQEVAFFDERKTGELVSRLGSDTAIVQMATSSAVPEALTSLIKVSVAVAYMVAISPMLTGAIVVGFVILFSTVIPFGKWLAKVSKRYQDALAEAQTMSTEALSSMRTVRSFVGEALELRNYKSHIGEPDQAGWCSTRGETTYALGVKKSIAGAGFGTFLFGIGFGIMYVALWLAFREVASNTITIGDLSAFASYIFQIGFGLAGVGGQVTKVLSAKGPAQRIFELLERVPTFALTGGDKPDTEMVGAVEFKDVVFAYPSRKEVKVLQDFSLQIPARSTCALVGTSGCGKSTCVALVQRFYEINSGEITIDGANINSLDPAWMRGQMGLVAQEPALFGLSVKANVTYGLSDERKATVTDEEIQDACKQANAHEFVDAFPEKYETLVGEKGVKLSGGQKQRIAIARALLVNPRILLLDEATSALDAESEHIVQEAIDRLMAGRTTLVVAHRLSTVRRADKIVVVDDHRIVDMGTHEQLMERCEKYSELVKRQTDSGMLAEVKGEEIAAVEAEPVQAETSVAGDARP